jgi:endogenous inhibitor of DNA gyrase (YacG/DUF329 family)
MKPIDCPTCKKRVEPSEPTFPFCSPRCRLVDLGNWLGGRYRIAGEPVAGEERGDSDAADEKGKKSEA